MRLIVAAHDDAAGLGSARDQDFGAIVLDTMLLYLGGYYHLEKT
jgi:hypothetical protein